MERKPVIGATILSIVAIATITTGAAAQSINIDIGEPGTGPSPTYAAAGWAGVWNSIPADHNTTTFGLLGLDGQPTDVRVWQFGGLEFLGVHDPATSGEDARLLIPMAAAAVRRASAAQPEMVWALKGSDYLGHPSHRVRSVVYELLAAASLLAPPGAITPRVGVAPTWDEMAEVSVSANVVGEAAAVIAKWFRGRGNAIKDAMDIRSLEVGEEVIGETQAVRMVANEGSVDGVKFIPAGVI